VNRPADDTPQAAPARVILCDDVPALRALARFTIEEGGLLEVVGEAGDAAEAVRLCGELRPDAILLDLSLPGMDGLEAIPLLHEAAPGVAVVVFSGFAAERMEGPALAQGAVRYVEKGADLSEVREALIEVVRNRRA
jgi:DNA-binding NarL/FixJ family response regulator